MWGDGGGVNHTKSVTGVGVFGVPLKKKISLSKKNGRGGEPVNPNAFAPGNKVT